VTRPLVSTSICFPQVLEFGLAANSTVVERLSSGVLLSSCETVPDATTCDTGNCSEPSRGTPQFRIESILAAVLGVVHGVVRRVRAACILISRLMGRLSEERQLNRLGNVAAAVGFAGRVRRPDISRVAWLRLSTCPHAISIFFLNEGGQRSSGKNRFCTSSSLGGRPSWIGAIRSLLFLNHSQKSVKCSD
jgi:hypothetical protein